MSYPTFTGVQKIEGGLMPFENYLAQIRLLYPNLAELYAHYLSLCNDLTAEQLARMIAEEQLEFSNELLLKILSELALMKEQNYDLFMYFVDTFDLKTIVQQLFEIEAGGGGGMPTVMKYTGVGYADNMEVYNSDTYYNTYKIGFTDKENGSDLIGGLNLEVIPNDTFSFIKANYVLLVYCDYSNQIRIPLCSQTVEDFSTAQSMSLNFGLSLREIEETIQAEGYELKDITYFKFNLYLSTSASEELPYAVSHYDCWTMGDIKYLSNSDIGIIS